MPNRIRHPDRIIKLIANRIVARETERKRRQSVCGRSDGSIVLEAALTLPLFLSFLIAMIALIQISVTEMALQSAVSESAKVVAAHMYPVDLLYTEAKSQWSGSAPGIWLGNVLDKIESAHSVVVSAETFVDDYSKYIPDAVVQIVKWEKELRERTQGMAADEARTYAESVYKPLLNKAFTAIVLQYADRTLLNENKFRVTNVELPDLEHKDDAWIAIEAEYELKLAVPFYRKTVVLKKKASERAWVGAS